MKIRFGQTFETMQRKGFYLTCPMKIKMLIFRNNKKNVQATNRSKRGVGNIAVGRDIWYDFVDCFS